MTTGYDAKFYHDIGQIAQSLNLIVSLMEAREKRERETPPLERAIREALGEEFTTPEDMVQIGLAIQAVRKGFVDLEAAIQREREDGTASP